MKRLLFKISLIVVIFLSPEVSSNGQPSAEDYKKGTISEQLDQVEAHTRIYDNYRAVREDIFQIISRNVKDTLKIEKKRINNLSAEIVILKSHIDSKNKSFESTKSSLEEITRTKNNIKVLGMEVNKTSYNSIMWTILGIVILLLIIGFLLFTKNTNIRLKAMKELIDLQKEFEDYKQKKRIEQENMTMSYFNEIKKLKEVPPKR